jgi:hypothetical protein
MTLPLLFGVNVTKDTIDPDKEPTKVPSMHVAFGLGDFLGSFVSNLRITYYQRGKTVIVLPWPLWKSKGLTAYDQVSDFPIAFAETVSNPLVELIHFNVEGLRPDPLTVANTRANNGVYLQPFQRGSSNFLVTAWELYEIINSPDNLCDKTLFYTQGSSNTNTPNVSMHVTLCGTAGPDQ